jgi:hypothetical protein
VGKYRASAIKRDVRIAKSTHLRGRQIGGVPTETWYYWDASELVYRLLGLGTGGYLVGERRQVRLCLYCVRA